jgi:hypothetical protein
MIPSKNNYATPSPKESIATIQQDLTRKILELRVRLKALVKSLPEASSDVRRLPGAARGCVVSLSAITLNGGILSPSYYLTSDAIEYLERLIDTTDITTLDKKIQEIIKTGKINKGAGYVQSLNTEFIEALRHAWEGDSNATSIPQ